MLLRAQMWDVFLAWRFRRQDGSVRDKASHDGSSDAISKDSNGLQCMQSRRGWRKQVIRFLDFMKFGLSNLL